MRLISDTVLATRTEAELAVLFQVAAEALATTKPGTPERRTLITSMQNIRRAQARRQRGPRPPGL